MKFHQKITGNENKPWRRNPGNTLSWGKRRSRFLWRYYLKMRIHEGNNYSWYRFPTQEQWCRWPSHILYEHMFSIFTVRHCVHICGCVFLLQGDFNRFLNIKSEEGERKKERARAIWLCGVSRPWGLCLWTLITKPVSSQGLENLDKWSRNALRLPDTCRLPFADASRIQAAGSGQAPARRIQFRKYWSVTNASST